MNIREINNNLPLLHSLYKCPGNSERNILFSHLDDKSFKFLCQCIQKCIADPSILKLSNPHLSRIRKTLVQDKDRVNYAIKSGRVTKNKRIAIRQSGEGIGLLLGVLAPVLISLVKDLITKKKK